MKLAVLTPLPPTRTGIAHYASMLLPALAKRAEVRAFESLEGYRREDFDEVIYQLGNNPYHELVFREAMREPGIAVLHDLVLHHLIVEMTLARGDADGYFAAMRANHGEAGEAWARARAAGLHAEIGNFLFPASVEVANRSKAVIVHNRYAASRLASLGVKTPIHVVPHPYVRSGVVDGVSMRTKLGIDPAARVIGFFGFLTSAKRAEVVLEAFRRARSERDGLVLLIVGEPAPDIDREALQGDGIIMTGYVADDDFPAYYAAADRLVNLRYPSAGETSGTLIRALDAGKPVAVSDYAQFAEMSETCVVRIPLGDDEVGRLTSFFVDDLPDPAPAQRRWLEEHATLDATVDGYLRVLEATAAPIDASPVSAALPLFPGFELIAAHRDGRRVHVAIRNAGDATIEARNWGQPVYRLIARTYARGGIVETRWLGLASDLHPGEQTIVAFDAIGLPDEIHLVHALQDVPLVDAEPWARAELLGVR